MAGSSSSGRGPPSPFSPVTFGGAPVSDVRLHSCATFLAGDTDISVIPNFNYKASLGLVSRSVGPFRAGIDTVVPLWLAVMLRRRNLCRIVTPGWMDVERLKAVLQFERDPDRASFSPDLPFRHAEIARAVLSVCGAGSGSANGTGVGGGDAEIPHADEIRVLLEDIATVRMDKIRRNVHTLSAQSLSRKATLPIIDVTGIGSLEMQAIRPFVTSAFRDHRALVNEGDAKKVVEVSASEARNDALRRTGRRGRREAKADEGLGPDADLDEPTAPSAPQQREGRSRIRRFR